MNLGELFNTKRWKTFMGFVYGWGAAIVMIGALFKLQHWQFSGLLLTIGLCTEAVIFFLSAFEPPMEMPDWGKVYPELRDDYEIDPLDGLKPQKGKGLEQLLNGADITPDLLDKVGKGLNELSNTARGISDISSATLATDMYVKSLGSASESMSTMAQINSKANESIDKSVATLLGSYNEAAERFAKTGTLMSETYEKSSEVINSGLYSIGSKSNEYAENLEKLNKSLHSLNNDFESQLNDTKEQFKATIQFNKELGEMNAILTSSVDELKRYKENAEQLNKNLEALNTIYGNMLGAMSINK